MSIMKNICIFMTIFIDLFQNKIDSYCLSPLDWIFGSVWLDFLPFEATHYLPKYNLFAMHFLSNLALYEKIKTIKWHKRIPFSNYASILGIESIQIQSSGRSGRVVFSSLPNFFFFGSFYKFFHSHHNKTTINCVHFHNFLIPSIFWMAVCIEQSNWWKPLSFQFTQIRHKNKFSVIFSINIFIFISKLIHYIIITK